MRKIAPTSRVVSPARGRDATGSACPPALIRESQQRSGREWPSWDRASTFWVGPQTAWPWKRWSGQWWRQVYEQETVTLLDCIVPFEEQYWPANVRDIKYMLTECTGIIRVRLRRG